MTDNKVADKPPTSKDSSTDSTSSAVKTESKVSKPEHATEKPAVKADTKPAAGATAKKQTATKTRPKAEKISAADKKNADDAIKSKQSINDLKARAHEAKLRAQKKILEKSYVSDPPVDPLERLANTFDSSAKRWEMVVYPSLFAFVLLAGYGFFLIYRLTHDISTLSQSVTRMAVIVSDAMPRMTKDLNLMTDSMDNMTGDIGGMTTEIVSMSDQMNALTPMSSNIQSMTQNIGSMNRSVYGMQRDMHGMNRTVSSGPFGMMNDVMPFTSNTNVPPAMAPPPVWPAYGNTAPYQYYAKPKAATKAKPEKKAAAKESIKKEITVPGASPVIAKELPGKEKSITKVQ
jgi:methyl-accepting chemotaxis protein